MVLVSKMTTLGETCQAKGMVTEENLDENKEPKMPLRISPHDLSWQQDSPLMILATRAFQEWQKRASVTDALTWGATLTKLIKSHKEYKALLSAQGLQRLVVVSAGRPQFKLVHRSITIPKRMVAKYRIGAGPIRVKLCVKGRGETWDNPERDQCFTASWFDLPQKYRICLIGEHEINERPRWMFWYRPVQAGSKAKKAAVELARGLDELIDANRDVDLMDIVTKYLKE
jgi:hypothetical protein